MPNQYANRDPAALDRAGGTPKCDRCGAPSFLRYPHGERIDWECGTWEDNGGGYKQSLACQYAQSLREPLTAQLAAERRRVATELAKEMCGRCQHDIAECDPVFRHVWKHVTYGCDAAFIWDWLRAEEEHGG